MHISIVMPAPGDPGLVGTGLGLPISVLEVQWNDHGRILESPGCKGINRQVSALDRQALHTFCNMNKIPSSISYFGSLVCLCSTELWPWSNKRATQFWKPSGNYWLTWTTFPKSQVRPQGKVLGI